MDYTSGMLSRLFCLLLVSGLLSFAGTETKPKVEDYPVHSSGKDMDIGVDFGGHTYTGKNHTFVADDYMCLEVAVFAESGRNVVVQNLQFTVRGNGKKQLMAQTPGIVVSSLKYPDWERQSHTSAEPGPGMGGPQRGPSRFPGDPRSSDNPPPGTSRTDATPVNGDDAKITPAQLAMDMALPEGTVHTSVSGYLYFPFRGTMKSIRTLELIYNDGVSEPIVVKVR